MTRLILKRLAVAVWLICPVFAQDAPALRGTWTATVGTSQVYRGSWSARPLPGEGTGAQGSWTVLNDANQKVLEGTWAAAKSPAGWQGTWSARVLTRPSSAERVFSGTWRAEIDDSSGTTLVEMLQRSVQAQVTGSWRSGPLSGNWAIRGSR